jgi:hypothetical protein
MNHIILRYRNNILIKKNNLLLLNQITNYEKNTLFKLFSLNVNIYFFL